MKKLVIIALVAISGLEAKNHKLHVKHSGLGLVRLLNKAGNDVETVHVKNNDKIIVTAKDLRAFQSLKGGLGYGPEIEGRLSVAAFDNNVLKVRKTGNKFEVTAVNDTDVPVSTTLMIKAT